MSKPAHSNLPPPPPISGPGTGGQTVTTTPEGSGPWPVAPGTGGVVVGQGAPPLPYGIGRSERPASIPPGTPNPANRS